LTFNSPSARTKKIDAPLLLLLLLAVVNDDEDENVPVKSVVVRNAKNNDE
jgi:hypothetical protein